MFSLTDGNSEACLFSKVNSVLATRREKVQLYTTGLFDAFQYVDEYFLPMPSDSANTDVVILL